MKRILQIFALSLAGLTCIQLAHAGEVTGTITFLQSGQGYTADNVYTLVQINVTPSSQPSCATDPRFALNPATAPGKVFLAMLMAAQAAGKTVTLYGTGNCNVMGNEFESIAYLRVHD